jgi:hypothetical protein
MLGRNLSADVSAELARNAASNAEKLLHFNGHELGAKYNIKPFLVNHSLSHHPLCSLTKLFQLCHSMPSANIRIRHGVVPYNTNVDTVHEDYGGLSIEEATEQLETQQAHIMIVNPELDATYKHFIEQLVGEVFCAVRPFDSNFTWYSTYFFLSAGDALTPYHMDREMNFLLQIQGKKRVELWDPFDEDVNARPPFKPDTISQTFELTPGVGVHHPFIAPHLVRTSSAPSVSIAITFRTEHSDTWTDAHCFNQLVRKLGMNPRPAREVDWVDSAKARTIRFFRKVKHSF